MISECYNWPPDVTLIPLDIELPHMYIHCCVTSWLLHPRQLNYVHTLRNMLPSACKEKTIVTCLSYVIIKQVMSVHECATGSKQ